MVQPATDVAVSSVRTRRRMSRELARPLITSTAIEQAWYSGVVSTGSRNET